MCTITKPESPKF